MMFPTALVRYLSPSVTAFMETGACVKQNSMVEMENKISPAVMMTYWGSCQNMLRVFSGVTYSNVTIRNLDSRVEHLSSGVHIKKLC